jgi:hypothetical protein
MGLFDRITDRVAAFGQTMVSRVLTDAMDSARAKALADLEALYRGQQYEGRGLAPSWDKLPPTARRIPLRLQRPSVQYDLPRLIVDRPTALLFGEGRFPRLQYDPLGPAEDASEVTAWLSKVAEEGRLQHKCLTFARMAHASGAGCITWAVVDGEFEFTPHRAAFCVPTFHPQRCDRLVALEKRYKFTRRVQDLEAGVLVTREVLFWHRETWDEQRHVVYQDVPVGDGKEPTWTVAAEAVHDFGFVPGVWAKALDDGDTGPCGVSLLDGLADIVEDMDRTLSQKSRAIRYNQEPDRVVYGAKPQPPGGVQVTGGGAITEVAPKDQGGGVELLEMGGEGQRVAEEHVVAQRGRTLETARVVSPDADKLLAAARSGSALRILHAPTLELVGELRQTTGRTPGELAGQIVRAAREGTLQRLGALTTPPPAKIPEGRVRTVWGKFFDPTPEDLQTIANVAGALVEKQVCDRETAVRWVCQWFGFDDVEGVLSRLGLGAAKGSGDAEQPALAATTAKPGTVPADPAEEQAEGEAAATTATAATPAPGESAVAVPDAPATATSDPHAAKAQGAAAAQGELPEVFGYDYDAGILTVDEARARKGLPALPDGRGNVSVILWKAQQTAEGQRLAGTSTPPGAPPTNPRFTPGDVAPKQDEETP